MGTTPKDPSATAAPHQASEHIDDMIAMITTLINKNLAYVADNGDVCYAVGKFTSYGSF